MANRPIHVLLVAAHPADTFDQAGGTLAHHIEQGDTVTCIIATTGVRSHHWELAEEKRQKGASLNVEERVQAAVEEKLEETRRACRILGFDDVRDLGFEDDDILVTQDKIEAIANVIRTVKPDLIISHHPYETGGLKMHGTIGQCTVYASQLARGAGRGTQQRHVVPTIYFMNPIAYIGANSLEYASTCRVDLLVDISDVIERKVLALDQIASQYYGGPYSRKRAETEDGHYGQKGEVAYAEAFQRFEPMVRYTIPVTDAELMTINLSQESAMGRRSETSGGLMPLSDGMAYSSQYRFTKEQYEE
ncbi:MAG: putative N-acetyl-alpha-D-glucosaminyl L-malate deacetylase 2 [Candidatus Moanabacter tarae]|uniref:Putative N-acetyl-alpha-D-glucosaminyl L-malate deacetylase 2 n=1 Tax=Candidatus Moanibacter tarae TaxID=2200854 RepID=A0A2Z4AK86_9BACT|nr:MAG: putative N-acetyl-alpha-D-glucosaminyl L-malate deacetylase 2 [Candidatus Moanabacter tarae]|tara:strand:- start:39173 stop:40087 length:915 start_codon:yes stop_codon:yes gene_type:complete